MYTLSPTAYAVSLEKVRYLRFKKHTGLHKGPVISAPAVVASQAMCSPKSHQWTRLSIYFT